MKYWQADGFALNSGTRFPAKLLKNDGYNCRINCIHVAHVRNVLAHSCCGILYVLTKTGA